MSISTALRYWFQPLKLIKAFFFHGDDLTKYKTKWLQKVRRYRELKAEESQALEEGQ